MTGKILPKKAIQNMEAYSAPLEGRRNKIRLDFNENTTGFPDAYEGLPAELINAYPEYDAFLEKLAKHFGVKPENLMLTNGSAEALFLIPFTFIEPDEDVAVVSTPTFPIIPHSLRLVQAKLREVTANPDLTYNVDGLEQALAEGAKLCIIATPDNPTGAVLDADVILRWCDRFPDTLFVIDEAYYEFDGRTVLPEVTKRHNLLVTRSFSKAWSLASLRLGVIIGPEELMKYIGRAKSPYSVNAVAVKLASNLLDRHDEVQAQAQAIMARKQRMIEEVRKRGYDVVEGAGNFFLLKAGFDSKTLSQFCYERGVLLRDRSGLPHMWGTIRVNAGTDDEIERFLECLDEFRQSRALIFDLDDTLVDTSQSYDATILQLLKDHTGKDVPRKELKALRAEGGFNDDWDATRELLRRHGIEMTREQVEAEGKRIYLGIALDTEDWLMPAALFEKLKHRYRLMVVTGRPRDEYGPVWQSRLDPLVECCVCQDDYDGLPRKPAPDVLKRTMRETGITGGIYVGNSVDDMRAAKGAGLKAIGVTSTHEAQLLSEAGADTIIESMNDLRKVLML